MVALARKSLGDQIKPNARGFALGQRGLLMAASILGSTLSGCAAYTGSPDPIAVTYVASDNKTYPVTVKDNCPSDAAIQAFESGAPPRPGETRAQWRDEIIGDCVSRVDAKYSEFIIALHKNNAATSLGFDLAGLALTGVGAVASKGAANALSAAATGVAGAGTAVDKDLFYQKTLPAIIAQMDANRAAVYASIKTSEKVDETVTPPPELSYTLSDAQHDIRAYEAAGSIDEAINAITASAQTSSAKSLAEVKKALATSVLVDAATAKFHNAFKACVNTITAKADLDPIAAALGVKTASGETISIERLHVLIADLELHDSAAVAKAALALAKTKCPETSP